MEELTKLLNKLMDIGWKPRGLEHQINWDGVSHFLSTNYRHIPIKYSLNDLISEESGLFQFVVDNKLYKKQRYNKGLYVAMDTNFKHYGEDEFVRYKQEDIEYRLMLAGLNNTVKFLLNNIKLDD